MTHLDPDLFSRFYCIYSYLSYCKHFSINVIACFVCFVCFFYSEWFSPWGSNFASHEVHFMCGRYARAFTFCWDIAPIKFALYKDDATHVVAAHEMHFIWGKNRDKKENYSGLFVSLIVVCCLLFAIRTNKTNQTNQTNQTTNKPHRPNKTNQTKQTKIHLKNEFF